MATFTTPRYQRHTSGIFHRHRSDSLTRSQSLEQPAIFEGTDAVPQNRKVALQRVIEAHNALEHQHQVETSRTTRPVSPASSISSDQFTMDFNESPIPDAEVRTFKYFLRKWDPSSVSPDPRFEELIEPSKLQFEAAAVKHFFRRVVLWNESEEILQATKQRLASRWRKKDKQESQLLKMWLVEKEQAGGNTKDDLKEITSREGLAQLLWTLLHDTSQPLAPELKEEFTQALKKYYRMES